MSTRRSKRRAKRQARWRQFLSTPHLFAKLIVTHCIVVVTIAAFYSLWAQSHGAEMTPLYTAIAASFISELAMLLLKTLFKKDLVDKEEEKDEDLPDEPGI